MSCPARLAFRRLRGGANPPMKAVGGPERAGRVGGSQRGTGTPSRCSKSRASVATKLSEVAGVGTGTEGTAAVQLFTRFMYVPRRRSASCITPCTSSTFTHRFSPMPQRSRLRGEGANSPNRPPPDCIPARSETRLAK